ncbi:MAG: IS110 family transposase, partial [Actinomycetota bacterium]
MTTIGIDIGGRSHVVARCRDGTSHADREVLRVSQSRAGFSVLDAWLARQPAPVTLVTMESSGHYWMPLASHLRRRDVPVAVVNPLAAKYFARSRLARTKSDPADARSLAEMGMRDTPVVRDPLAGAELRQAARFAMTLVEEQAKVCQRLIRLVELGFPELGELFDDPTCRTAREILRIAPTAQAATRRRTTTLANANANAGPGHRRLGRDRAERLQAAAADSIAVPELDVDVQGRQQPPAGGGLSDGRRRCPAQPGHRRSLCSEAGRRADRSEGHWTEGQRRANGERASERRRRQLARSDGGLAHHAPSFGYWQGITAVLVPVPVVAILGVPNLGSPRRADAAVVRRQDHPMAATRGGPSRVELASRHLRRRRLSGP